MTQELKTEFEDIKRLRCDFFLDGFGGWEDKICRQMIDKMLNPDKFQRFTLASQEMQAPPKGMVNLFSLIKHALQLFDKMPYENAIGIQSLAARTKEFSATLCNRSLHPTTKKQKQRVFDTHKNMVVVGDVIVSKIIEKLVEIGFEYAADRYFARDTRMKVELERLNDALPRVQAVVEMAESGQQEINGALKKWLWQLKDAVYEADNVLDELDYLKLQKQAEMKAAGAKGHDHSRKH
ncbi:uncharacterized protein A4U43_C06F6660 [Asparagus officinalis]|uniref:Disease resistance N-terminal domain-containing protein n=1 Tax=Asparagus officinalis TaxID=4686 RepID=A0A5P1EKM7_ASPOF|nr:uncharacterized protein A4U43_C06F6660 [Asparagus officinalis]